MTNAQIIDDNDISSKSGLTKGREAKTKWLPAEALSLILYFLDKRKDIHPDALHILSMNDWGPGTRKIMNFVDALANSAGVQTITPADLPSAILTNGILNGVLGGDKLSYIEAKKQVIDEFDRIISTQLSQEIRRQSCVGSRRAQTGQTGMKNPAVSGF